MIRKNKTHLESNLKAILGLITLGSFLLSSCDFIKTTSTSVENSTTGTNTNNEFEVSRGDNPTNPPDQTPVPLPEPTPNPEDPSPIAVEDFILQNNARFTKSRIFDIETITLNRNKMKIGFSDQCADGDWQPWRQFFTIENLKINQLVTVSIQYQDWDLNISKCYKKQIIQDEQGPEILYQLYPDAQLEEGSGAGLKFFVSDALTAVKTVNCSLNGVTKNCFAGSNEVNIPSLPIGDYTFSVSATDILDNKSEKSVSWKVTATTKKITQNILVDNYKKIDILFVIDNSGSMAYEQKSMASRTSNFISVLKGLDWQIGITTTDPSSSIGDGRLVPINTVSNRYIIDSTWADQNAQSALSSTLQRSETGSGSEQGIRAVYRAVERYTANEANQRSLIRDQSQLAVVLISDEDESANTVKNNPQDLLKLIDTTFQGQKRFNFHSIITRPGDKACLSTYGATYGERYQVMSQLTGGLIGDVCASDYAAQAKGIAQEIRNLLKTLTLTCAPLSNKPIMVEKNGTAVSTSFTIEGVNLKFASELEPGQYTVKYSCVN